MINRFVFLPVLFFVFIITTRAADIELLKHGGMEGPFANGIAQGWAKNCYGSNDVMFAEETSDIHSGKSAQNVTCTKFITGGVQFHSGSIAVEKGKPYTLRLWMKGDSKMAVYVGIRKHGAPYTSYLKRSLRVKNEWTPYLIMSEASESDPDCGIYIMFAGTGKLLVDDLSLVSGLHEESIAESGLPPKKGNRIYNSGFEAGPEGWTPVGGFSIDDTQSHSGKFSARIGEISMESVNAPINRPLPPNFKPRVVPTGLECRPFPVRTGQRYTLSAWIRAEKPKTSVQMSFFEWADDGGDSPDNRHKRETRITVTNEWARYQFSGVVLPNLWEEYVARIVPSGTIWVDDMQIEEGDITDYVPAQSIEVGAETETRWCIVGDQVDVTAHVASATPLASLILKYTLEDLWSRPLKTISHTLKGEVSDHANFELKQPGMYRIRVQVGDAPATGEVWFGVFPKRDRQIYPDSAFGTHVTAVVPKPTNTMLASEAMGARWVRLHDFGDFCHWRVVEPEKGRFVWCDEEINDLRKCGFMILANLGHTPLWAGRVHPDRKDHGSWTDAPPRDNDEWENYVFKTVEHFKDRIHHWEVWNEPCWKTFFSGTPEEYAEFLKIAYRAIKRADPQAIVIGGCFSSHAEDWTKRVLAKDGLDFMDALSYHVYWSPPLTESSAPAELPFITKEVQRFVELMRERDKVKPIYMTEGGIRCPPFASWLPKEGFSRGAAFGSQSGASLNLTGVDAAAGLVRGMVQMLSAGVVNICYYYTGGVQGAMPWFSTMANGYYVIMDYDGRPKPTMMAYSALESMIGDAKFVKVINRNDLTIHLFMPAKGSVAVVWSDRERPIELPGRITAFDMMGNKLVHNTLHAGEPVYICSAKLGPDKLANMLK